MTASPIRLGERSRDFFHRYGKLLLQVAVVIGVLLLSARIGYRPPLSLNLLAAGLGAVLTMLLTWNRIPLALTALVFTSALVDLSISTGTKSPVHFSLVLVMLLAVIWVVRMLLAHRLALAPNPANLPLIVFNLAVLVSWIAGYAFWKSSVPRPANALTVQAGQVAMYALSTAAFLLAANHRLTEKDIKRWFAAIVALGMAGTALDLLPFGKRPAGVHGSMLMWPFVLVWSQLLFNPSLSRRLRRIGWLTLPFWIYWFWSLHYGWKSAWVPALLALGILLFLHSRSLALGIGFVALFLVIVNWGVFFPTTILAEQQGGSLLRPAIWYDVLRLASHSPILGLGPANYMYYWRDPTFVSYSMDFTNWWAWYEIGYAPPSHNMFVDVLAQTGVVGFAAFAWAMAGLVILARRACQILPVGFLRAYAYGVLAGFLALAAASFVFADWLIPFVYNISIKGFQHSLYSWLLLGSLVSLVHNRPVPAPGRTP